jgi:hypothetical protein
MATLASALETVALDQKRWSLTANALRVSIRRARILSFSLTVSGAILETLAAQLYLLHPGPSEIPGYMGAAALACVVIIKAQSLGRDRLQGWILSRAASESLKREMYRYRTSSGPYADASRHNPEATLFERRDDILSKVSTVQKFIREPDPTKVAVGGPLDANGYISERIQSPISWFRGRADEYSASQSRWSAVEYSLAIAGALSGVALTFTHNQAFGAWVAVITTISGAVAAYVMAERYEQITISYRTTADRLTSILGRWIATPGELSQLVEQVEATLLEENQAWIAGADELIKQLVSPPGQAGSKSATPA